MGLSLTAWFQGRDPWTLEHAADVAMEQHWRGKRKADTMASWTRELQRLWPDKTLKNITTRDIETYTRMMQADGLAPATVHAKVCCISTIYEVAKANGYAGPVPHIPRPAVKKPLKWWLTPDMEPKVLAWLEARAWDNMRDYVLWTVETGLRLEETMRVNAGMFSGLAGNGIAELLVPGTKTARAQRTIALSSEARRIAVARYMALGGRQPLFHGMTYWHMTWVWNAVRQEFGWTEEATCTLKALRRSFARRLTARGCPLPVVQAMMGHSDTGTTMGYLKLVGGGYTLEEQSKWLS